MIGGLQDHKSLQLEPWHLSDHGLRQINTLEEVVIFEVTDWGLTISMVRNRMRGRKNILLNESQPFKI
jgi:hypothetical protein